MHIKSKCLSETVVVFHELGRIVRYPISTNAFFFLFFSFLPFQFYLGSGGAQKFNLRSKSRHWNLNAVFFIPIVLKV